MRRPTVKGPKGEKYLGLSPHQFTQRLHLGVASVSLFMNCRGCDSGFVSHTCDGKPFAVLIRCIAHGLHSHALRAWLPSCPHHHRFNLISDLQLVRSPPVLFQPSSTALLLTLIYFPVLLSPSSSRSFAPWIFLGNVEENYDYNLLCCSRYSTGLLHWGHNWVVN